VQDIGKRVVIPSQRGLIKRPVTPRSPVLRVCLAPKRIDLIRLLHLAGDHVVVVSRNIKSLTVAHPITQIIGLSHVFGR
jgi:hypothetical protein